MTVSADKQALTQELIREFVVASHGDLTRVKEMLAAHPALLRVEFDWGPGGREDGIGAAGHVGNREIAEFFLAQGVPLNICVSAMLGRLDKVNRFLTSDPALANARGAHGITVMFHAAMSGDVRIAETLRNHGCKEGFSHAIHGAINFRREDMVVWLLANGATLMNVLDYQNKTPLARALETNQPMIADLLRQHGATETA